MPLITVLSSFGAIRMQHRSHQTLKSSFGVSTFVFMITPHFIYRSRLLLLKACNRRRAIVVLVPAWDLGAGQNEFFSPNEVTFVTPVHSKENWRLALAAEHAEIPPCIGLGPLRNMHKGTSAGMRLITESAF
jgi:hypothetical protein